MLAPTTSYAASALAELARHRGGPLSVSRIAEATDLPPAFLARIVGQMARYHLVETRRGVRGGVRLMIDPAKMSLFDLARLFDDPVLTRRCMLGMRDCHYQGRCPAREACVMNRRRLRTTLRETTIAVLARANAAPVILGAASENGQSNGTYKVHNGFTGSRH
jgi:Rrf2 family nitric oxide-sensitive transcriptional repressor